MARSGCFAMHHSPAGLRSCAKPWASMRSPRCRPRRSIRAAGIVNLTTVLAHASGEWIASDWPVCPISETATPHRMGAALTYARRYALFTLVGIAGEDDLDAPDLVAPTTPSSGLEPPNGGADVRSNGGAKPHSGYRPPVRRHGRAFPNLPTPGLTPEASAQLRDQLLSQLDAIVDGDKAALWAKRSLPDKNKLMVADAQRVEEAFQARLAGIAPVPEQTEQRPQSHGCQPQSAEETTGVQDDRQERAGIAGAASDP